MYADKCCVCDSREDREEVRLFSGIYACDHHSMVQILGCREVESRVRGAEIKIYQETMQHPTLVAWFNRDLLNLREPPGEVYRTNTGTTLVVLPYDASPSLLAVGPALATFLRKLAEDAWRSPGGR